MQKRIIIIHIHLKTINLVIHHKIKKIKINISFYLIQVQGDMNFQMQQFQVMGFSGGIQIIVVFMFLVRLT